jgi:hypothetical protein
MPPRPKRPTARPDLSERAFFLTVPLQATIKSLCGERPVFLSVLVHRQGYLMFYM